MRRKNLHWFCIVKEKSTFFKYFSGSEMSWELRIFRFECPIVIEIIGGSANILDKETF